MANLNDREQAFENMYQRDQDIQFRVQSRAIKQLGFWAAEKLGMSGYDAECYAQQVVDADFDEPGVEDVFRKISNDFTAQQVSYEDGEMARIYDEKCAAAKHSVMNEG